MPDVPREDLLPEGSPSVLRVDFLGPYGVGKTTLLRALVRNRPRFRRRSLLSHEEARVEIATRLARRAGSYSHTARALLFNTPRAGAHLADRYLRLAMRLALEQRRADWGEFIRACLETIMTPTEPDPVRQLLGSWKATELLGQIALMERYGGSQAVLVDESITQFVGVLHLDAQSMRQGLAERLHSFPAPAAVLYISGTEETIVERWDKRERSRRAALSDGERTLDAVVAATRRSRARCEALIPVLAARSVPVLELNCLDPLDDQVRAARSFLASLTPVDDRRLHAP